MIGAGMAGLAAAHAAAARGARVVVLEAGHRPGGRVRTVHPRWAGGAAIECGPEFVDEHHVHLRDACARAGVRLRPVTGGLHTFADGVLDPADRPGPREASATRLTTAYWAHVHDLATGVPDPDHPNAHPRARELDAAPVQALFERLAREVDAAPGADAALARFVQGVLGAEPTAVSTLFVVQQAAIDGGGSSARVDEGLGAVAAHLAATITAPGEVRFGARVVALVPDAERVAVHSTRGVVHARGVVLAVPLPTLASLDPTGVLPETWHRAAIELRYGSLVKTTVPTPATVPGWAVASDLPTALLWQPRPGLATTYTGGAGAEALAARPARDVIAQAAADVAAITDHAAGPGGGTWRWTPTTRRGGCYVVFGPGQVGAHWDVLRARVGPFALAGEHCGASTGYVEGAMQAGRRAVEQLLA